MGFITYTNEANAQFAKEAMAHQSLDHEETLNVRWATADPNPMAQAREARKVEEQAAEAIRRALPAEFLAEIEGKDPDTRKRRRIEGDTGPGDHHQVGYQEPNMIEDGVLSEMEREANGQGETQGDDSGGIFSSRTLAALNTAQVSVASKSKSTASAGPLVAYDSDSDE